MSLQAQPRRGAKHFMAQSIATVQAVEEDIRQKMSFTPPSQQAASIPQPNISPHKPGRSPRGRYLARRLLPDHSYSRADGADCRGRAKVISVVLMIRNFNS